MRTRNGFAAVVLAVVGVLGITACSSGSSGSSASKATATTSAAATSGAMKVVSFEVPATAACSGKTSTTVTVTYATSGAAKEQLSVDGRPVALNGPSGSVQAPVHCDALPHTFVLFAYDAAGHHVAAEKKLTTNL